MRGNTGPRFRCHVPRSHSEEKLKPGPPGLGRWLDHLMTMNRENRTYSSASYDTWDEDTLVPAPAETAQFASSRLRGSTLHLPVLDIDTEAFLSPSKTPGHYHLLINRPMPWRKYKRLLRALVRAGVIEKAWARAAISGGQSLIALPRER